MTSSVAPFVIFFIGAAIAAVTRGRMRAAVLVAIPVLGAVNLYFLPQGNVVTYTMFDYTLTLVRVDRLSMLFGIVFHLGALLGIVYSLHVRDTTQHVAGVLYAGSALGATFAGDMITLFAFWELLAITSVFLILARRTERARAASIRYLLIQVLSGVILLAGVLIRVFETGSVDFGFIGLAGPGETGYLSSWLIFLAFGIKCGFPLLHNWLTDSYPEATPTGTVFLSAFTTKVAIYALARGFPGTELLVYIGATMTVFPIFYAVLENDLRRVLSYSMINQLGFMVCGIGIGTELAINGAVSHAFNDVVFKGLLLMSMGAVLKMTGKIKASELGGLYKTMPLTSVFCIIGAITISALPLFSAFASKSMVMLAALDEGYPVVWLALLFASAGVVEHAGIKIPFFAFFAHDSGIRTREPPTNMLVAMALAAVICVFNGAYPWVLYSLLPFPVHFEPYTTAHVLTQLQLVLFAAMAFCVLKLTGVYPAELPGVNIDAEWTYRRLLPRMARAFVATFAPLDRALRRAFLNGVNRVIAAVFRHHGPEGALARSLQAGSMVFWVIVLLAAYLILYLV